MMSAVEIVLSDVTDVLGIGKKKPCKTSEIWKFYLSSLSNIYRNKLLDVPFAFNYFDFLTGPAYLKSFP